MLHKHIIVYRGTLPLNTYNRLLQFLYDNNIKYKTINKYAKTRDDAGLWRYYDAILFCYDKYIPYYTNRQELGYKEFIKQLAIKK